MFSQKIKCIFLCTAVILLQQHTFAQNNYEKLLKKKVLVSNGNATPFQYVSNDQLMTEGWSELPQPKFWQQVIQMSADSMLINVADVRQPVMKVCTKDWSCFRECDKDTYKDSVRAYADLDYNTNLFVTVGRREFYEIRKAIPEISKSTQVFIDNGVDPWYAQAILLIESPGKFHATSTVGARGPFQLMPYVARKYGLKITKTVDERTNIDRAAYAASQLLGRAWIPMTKAMLDTLHIPYNETDLWFRLLVLHSYHAGMGNVKAVIQKINPDKGGIELIKTMWQTEAKGFKNQSQNYSQIALATQLAFEKIVDENPDSIFLIQGDRAWYLYQAGKLKGNPGDLWKQIRSKYEGDLLDGMITANYFVEKTNEVKLQLYKPHYMTDSMAEHPYSEKELDALGNQLLKKRNVNDAIKVFELNVDVFPNSASARDSLGTAYKLAGQAALAQKQFSKSAELKKKAESDVN